MAEERHHGRGALLPGARGEAVGLEAGADDDMVEFLGVDRGMDDGGALGGWAASVIDAFDRGGEANAAAVGAEVGDEGVGEAGVVDDRGVG